MKKLIVVFLILLSTLTFLKCYLQTDSQEMNEFQNIEQTIGLPFSIPDNLLLANPEQTYKLLLQSAKETHTNILRAGLNYRADGQVEVIKYVLMTTNSELIDHYRLSSGQNLSLHDTQAGDYYLSSQSIDSKNAKQKGRIYDFGHNDLLSVQPLHLSYQHLPVAGQYFVEGKNPQMRNTFLNAFITHINKELNIQTDHGLTLASFKASNVDNADVTSTLYIDYLTYGQIVIVLLTLLLLIYYGFRESKTIGIYKLNGLSIGIIWYKILGKTIVILFGLSIVMYIGAAWIWGDGDYQFLVQCCITLFYTYGTVFVVSAILYVYIACIQIHTAIKNKTKVNLVFITNLVFKVACLLALISISISMIRQYEEIRETKTSLKGWEQSQNYGMFYPLLTGYDKEDAIDNTKFNVTVAQKLYPILNREGSLLINAREYEETALRLNKDYKGIRTIKVNNNYLSQFPIMDDTGNKVAFSESEKDYILLVPEKYKAQQQRIIDFFTNDRKQWALYQKYHYNQPVPDYMTHQKLKIVWLKNEQKVFSFNPDVFPQEGNTILDPIIEVITEKNSFVSDLNLILGNGASDPLKIKLAGKNSATTYNKLLPLLQNLKIDDNLKNIVTVDQYMLITMHDLEESLYLAIAICIVLLIVFVFILSQNLIMVINKFQQKFVVRKLFGTGWIKTYREFWLLFAITWMIQLAILLYIESINWIWFGSIGFFICIECLASIALIIQLEKRSGVFIGGKEMI